MGIYFFIYSLECYRFSLLFPGMLGQNCDRNLGISLDFLGRSLGRGGGDIEGIPEGVTWRCHMMMPHDDVTWWRHITLSPQGVTWWCHLRMSHDDITWWCNTMTSHDDITLWCHLRCHMMISHDGATRWHHTMMSHYVVTWRCHLRDRRRAGTVPTGIPHSQLVSPAGIPCQSQRCSWREQKEKGSMEFAFPWEGWRLEFWGITSVLAWVLFPFA